MSKPDPAVAELKDAMLQMLRLSCVAQHEELIFGQRAIFWMCIGCPHDSDPVIEGDPFEPDAEPE